jgi:Zn-dependent protease with chaperone function
MKRTRQQFLWSVGVLGALEGTLALLITLPLLADAGLEGTHSILRICHHAFRPHYLYPMTPLATLLAGVVLVAAARFIAAVRATVRQTRAVTAAMPFVVDAGLSERLGRIARSCGLQGPVSVCGVPLPLAFCYGFLRPRVCVSTGICALLDDGELAAVLMHEEYHRRRREPLRLVLLAGLGNALSFWPGLSVLLAEARTEVEVAADASAIARLGSVQALARALMKLLEPAAELPQALGLGVAIASLSPTAARVDCLTQATAEPYPPLSWSYFAGLAAALALPASALIMLAATTSLHSLLHPCHMA